MYTDVYDYERVPGMGNFARICPHCGQRFHYTSLDVWGWEGDAHVNCPNCKHIIDTYSSEARGVR